MNSASLHQASADQPLTPIPLPVERCIVFSDLHLGESQVAINQQFAAFKAKLKTLTAQKASAIVILGDLFDAWIGDDYSLINPWLIEQLASLQTALNGSPSYFVHGNRDFLISETFAAATGLTLLPETSLLSMGAWTLLLCHGDHLCVQDQAYMATRAQLRDPNWQHQVLKLDINTRLGMAEQARLRSQQATQDKSSDILDVDPSAVATYMDTELSQYPNSLMIHGHTHRPALHPANTIIRRNSSMAGRLRVTLGDWDPRPSWLQLDLVNTNTSASLQGELYARDWCERFILDAKK